MFILSVIATLFVAVIVDSLILYYPVYPNYVMPKYLRNFERNAPPRVFAKNTDIPPSGIVFLRKNLQDSFLNFPARSNLEERNNRLKLHSDRRQQKLEAINKPDVSVNNSQSKNTPTRFYAIFDSKSKQFVTSNEPELSRWNENDNEAASISKPYHEGTAQLISSENDTTVALFNQLTEELGTRSSTPFESDQKVESIISKIPDIKISNRLRSKFKISVIDSNAIVKPLKLFALRH
uniref:Uncharacterized protein n=1 Tax=Loa loa TaxID=7209 RepID=A0A1I7VTM0_LOALO